VALMPGQTATFATYTSYSRGINGIMLDVVGLAADKQVTAADFVFRVGNDDGSPFAWPRASAPGSITVRRGAGASGTDRVTLTWPDNAIRKTWLQVTVRATAGTGLASPDVFYFGNAVGESGNDPANARVTAIDETGARANQRSFLNPASIDFRFDYNRDRLVNATDQLIARSNTTSFVNALRLITVPAAIQAPAQPAAAGMFNGGPPITGSEAALRRSLWDVMTGEVPRQQDVI
jgi:hypothetical protein